MAITNITREEYLNAVGLIERYKLQLLEQLKECNIFLEEKPIYANDKLFYDADMSVRLFNAVRKNNFGFEVTRETKVSELAGYKRSDYMKCRNFGKRSLNELQELLSEIGLRFKPE